MAKRSDLKKLIPNAIVKGIQDTLEDIFAQSQEYVPVDNGILVNSGDVIPLKNGGQIIYTAPYAARMEFGDSFRPFRGTQTVSFSRHKREAHYRSNGTFVREAQGSAHSRTYENSRLVGFNSGGAGGPLLFRVMKGTPAVEGRQFLTRAFNERIGMLGTHIKNRLVREVPGTKSS